MKKPNIIKEGDIFYWTLKTGFFSRRKLVLKVIKDERGELWFRESDLWFAPVHAQSDEFWEDLVENRK